MKLYQSKKAMYSIFIFFALALVLEFIARKKESEKTKVLETEIWTCNNESIELPIPFGWTEIDTVSYNGVQLQTFMYSDLSKITIVCAENTESTVNRGKKGGLYYRTTKVLDYVIYYEGVREESLVLFDKSFDLIETLKN